MYTADQRLWIAKSDKEIDLIPKMANRHGIIAGATGKTVTIKVLAGAFSDLGVPVFMSDIKGDVSGFYQIGAENHHVSDRV